MTRWKITAAAALIALVGLGAAVAVSEGSGPADAQNVVTVTTDVPTLGPATVVYPDGTCVLYGPPDWQPEAC